MKMCQCIISSYQWICLSKGQWAIFLIWTTLHCGVILCHFLKHFPYIFSFIFWTPLNLPGKPALKNQHVCVGRKIERPFIRLSRLNQMNSRVMFRRWWGILWAFYTSICCERINLQRKLHDKLKTCAVCYPFTTRDCSQFGTGERQSKDTYAIRVVVSVQDRSLPTGCIRVRKIPKITSAILICEIVSVRVKSVTSWLMKNLNVRKLRAFVHICKRGRWLPDSNNNTYNSIL